MRVTSPIPKKRARIEIIPLIDIMFFLLASFMMVSLSQTHMKGIKVNLPAQGAPPTTVTKDYVGIRVSPEVAEYPDSKQITAQARTGSQTGERLWLIHDVE